jgi:hypothetical protein
MMRATLVQRVHTAHRVPSTELTALHSAPPAAAGSHSFRVCCAVDAFIALGGRSDKGGEISTDKLRAVIKDFGLTIDIDVSAAVACPTAHRPTADACSLTPTPDPVAASQRLIRETDTDHSGLIDYEEFKQMMVDKKR